MQEKIHSLLDFWFGDLGHADLPTSERTNLWFGEDKNLKDSFLKQFKNLYDEAIEHQLIEWENHPRGALALIILLDQYSRCLYKNSPNAYSQDERALKICLSGIEQKLDQSLTLIERVFFYMPLVHSEDSDIQERSIRLYQSLVSLSLTETTQVYQLFLAYAYAHFKVIKEFGRFPQRNKILGRSSTEAESSFLKNA